MAWQYGILFVATGQAYFDEARQAIDRLSVTNPEIPVAVYVDYTVEVPRDAAYTVARFTSLGNPFLNKIDAMANTCFEKTIFLDTDIAVLDRIDELFDLLAGYPIAAAHAPGHRRTWPPGVPEAFYEPNTGVVAYRRSAQIKELFARWSQLYRQNPRTDGSMDQPAFHQSVWELGVPLYILPPEYNYRTPFPGFARNRVKVLHGRPAEPDACARILNGRVSPRSVKPLE